MILFNTVLARRGRAKRGLVCGEKAAVSPRKNGVDKRGKSLLIYKSALEREREQNLEKIISTIN